VELARSYGAGLWVNAIAPGFFIGEQNRTLLLSDDGSLTARGQTIVDQRGVDVEVGHVVPSELPVSS
jgi:hypothetical protein